MSFFEFITDLLLFQVDFPLGLLSIILWGIIIWAILVLTTGLLLIKGCGADNVDL